MTRVLSRATIAAVFAVSFVGAGAAVAPVTTGGRDGLQVFAERVTAYAELHRRLDAVFPPWEPSNDMHLIELKRAYLASAIRRERPHARQGEIFEPSAVAAFRGVIAGALAGIDVELWLQDLYEECEMPAGYRPQVYAGYPNWATQEMPSVLLTVLPDLPAGIVYRLIDHDLLLWDVDANLIIDVLPDALPRAGS